MKLCYCVGNPVKLAKAPEEAPAQIAALHGMLGFVSACT